MLDDVAKRDLGGLGEAADEVEHLTAVPRVPGWPAPATASSPRRPGTAGPPPSSLMTHELARGGLASEAGRLGELSGGENNRMGRAL